MRLQGYFHTDERTKSRTPVKSKTILQVTNIDLYIRVCVSIIFQKIPLFHLVGVSC